MDAVKLNYHNILIFPTNKYLLGPTTDLGREIYSNKFDMNTISHA